MAGKDERWNENNELEATGIRHSSFGNSSFILHRLNLDPLLEFTSGKKAAGAELASQVVAEQRTVAGRAQ
jgi:hypothetical protein